MVTIVKTQPQNRQYRGHNCLVKTEGVYRIWLVPPVHPSWPLFIYEPTKIGLYRIQCNKFIQNSAKLIRTSWKIPEFLVNIYIISLSLARRAYTVLVIFTCRRFLSWLSIYVHSWTTVGTDRCRGATTFL